jgi:molybdopterin-guanine dinucleotide biosynthesis protein A
VAGGPKGLVGAVLAGGEARRMGGRDKASLRLGERPLIDWRVENLAPQTDHLIISANGEAARFSHLGLVVVPDAPRFAGLGPLGGLASLMAFVREAFPEADLLFVAPVDAPFTPPDLGTRLVEQLERGGGGVAFARSGGRDHPVCSVWRTCALPLIEDRLAARKLKVMEAITALAGTALEWPDAEAFANLNTPQDLARAEQRLRGEA